MGKGATFERLLCRELSRWWTGSPKQLVFWRTSNSGGGATVRHRKGIMNRSHAGDITATENIARPFIRYVTPELKVGYSKKKGQKGNLHDLFDRTNQLTLYADWIDQARKASERAKSKYWMLIHKRDRRETMCYFPSLMYAELCFAGCFTTIHPPFLSMTVTVGENHVSFVGMALDRFLFNVDPDDVRVLLKLGRKDRGEERPGRDQGVRDRV